MPTISYPALSEAVLTVFPYLSRYNGCSTIYDCVSYCSTCNKMKVYCGNCGDTYYDNGIYKDDRLLIDNKVMDTSVPIVLDDADPIRKTNIAGWIESNGLVYTFKDTLIPIMEIANLGILGKRNVVILIQNPHNTSASLVMNKYITMRYLPKLYVVGMSQLVCQDLYQIMNVQLHKINDDIIAVVNEIDYD